MIEEKKTGAARTQAAVTDEFWTDERVQGFLEMLPPEGMPADYNVLLKAYRGMLPDTFERLINCYIDAGRDINVRLEDGSTFLDHVSRHRKSTEYARLLEDAGATRTRAV
jgi:hypothetical protein